VTELKPPSPLLFNPKDRRYKIFLAGSIEQGAAVDWQRQVAAEFSELNIVVLNPRRDDWDPTWKQSPDNPNFRGQVEWELDGLIEHADLVFMVFDPTTRSVITLLELGLLLGMLKPVIVVCPEAYWRYGNVAITCERYNDAYLYTELAPALVQAKRMLNGDE